MSRPPADDWSGTQDHSLEDPGPERATPHGTHDEGDYHHDDVAELRRDAVRAAVDTAIDQHSRADAGPECHQHRHRRAGGR